MLVPGYNLENISNIVSPEMWKPCDCHSEHILQLEDEQQEMERLKKELDLLRAELEKERVTFNCL